MLAFYVPFPLQLYTLFINKEAVGTAIFTYDSLTRLLKYGNDSITYDVKGNILTKTDAGTYQYTNTAKPYAVTALAPASNSVPLRAQTVTYTFPITAMGIA